MINYLSGLRGLKHSNITAILEHTYHGECCHHPHPPMPDAGLGDWLLEIIESIFTTRGFIENIAASVFSEKLMEGLEKGYPDKWQETPYFGEDFNMLAALQRNVVHFSNAKDYTMQRAMLDALIDEEGKLRSWSDFRTVAYSIGNIHKDAWLRAEYEQAVSSAQMAAKWKQFVATADIFPMLRYDAIMDNHTTITCEGLNGVQLPISHWFWTQYFPPNHWGCRSNVQQTSDTETTDLNKVALPDIPDMFRTNTAQNGLLYPPGHPYYNGYDGSWDFNLLQQEVKNSAISRYEGKSVEVDGAGKVTISRDGILNGIINQEPGRDGELRVQLHNVLRNLLQNVRIVDSLTRTENGITRYYAAIPNITDTYVVIKETKKLGKIYDGITKIVR